MNFGRSLSHLWHPFFPPVNKDAASLKKEVYNQKPLILCNFPLCPFAFFLLCIESKKICEIWGQLNNFWAKELEIGPPKGHLTPLVSCVQKKTVNLPGKDCRKCTVKLFSNVSSLVWIKAFLKRREYKVRHEIIEKAYKMILLCYNKRRITVCPGSSYPFYIVSYNTKWVTTSWAYSISN